MRILALDLATTTGFCVIENGKILESGVWDLSRTKDEHYGHQFDKLIQLLSSEYYSCHDLTIAYEQAHFRSGPATRIGVGMNSAVLWFCAKHDIKPVSVHTATLKKWATGNGRAGKDEMIAKATEWLGREPIDDNEADAVCLAKYVEEQCNSIN